VSPVASMVLGLVLTISHGLALAAGIDDYKDLRLPETQRAQAGKNAVSVMFLGVATLLFDDGETAIMTDGYFSRPGQSALPSIEPNKARVTQALERAGVKQLAAVITVHSHFDHALDSPLVAQLTGATLVGSESTANIGRGQELPEAAIQVVKGGDSVNFGKFKVSFIKSEHLPANFALGHITAPLKFPAKASDMKVGDAFSILIENEGRSYLIQGSAGFAAGALAGRKADVVFLGVGGLGATAEAHQDAYWKEIVQAVGAKRVVPIHWDNFYIPLDRPLVAPPGIERTMEGVTTRGKRDTIDIRMPWEWKWTDPAAGLK
jgi:L-ascorbate metabolism protein UlaG (beta-lactamase superfamily)